jgi:hypothetical protein
VSNIPFDLTAHELQEVFRKLGAHVLTCEIFVDTRKQRGEDPRPACSANNLIY